MSMDDLIKIYIEDGVIIRRKIIYDKNVKGVTDHAVFFGK